MLSKLVVSDRPIHDTIGSMVVDGVFDRHPTLRVASIENGSDWLHLLIKRLTKQANQTPWVFPESPIETIRRHVWVTPYYEEDMRKLADTIGVERVLFGSDWPHGEGLANPVDFVKELHDFTDDEIRRVMRDNALELLAPAGAPRVTTTAADPGVDDDRELDERVEQWLAESWDPDLTVARVVEPGRSRGVERAALPGRVGRSRP